MGKTIIVVTDDHGDIMAAYSTVSKSAAIKALARDSGAHPETIKDSLEFTKVKLEKA